MNIKIHFVIEKMNNELLIQEQEKMTPELRKAILAAETLTELEDLYQPYKRKRRTRATIAGSSPTCRAGLKPANGP